MMNETFTAYALPALITIYSIVIMFGITAMHCITQRKLDSIKQQLETMEANQANN